MNICFVAFFFVSFAESVGFSGKIYSSIFIVDHINKFLIKTTIKINPCSECDTTVVFVFAMQSPVQKSFFPKNSVCNAPNCMQISLRTNWHCSTGCGKRNVLYLQCCCILQEHLRYFPDANGFWLLIRVYVTMIVDTSMIRFLHVRLLQSFESQNVFILMNKIDEINRFNQIGRNQIIQAKW